MKNLLKSLLLIFCCTWMISCGGDDPADPDNGGNNGNDDWNKTRTANILVFSRLSEGNLFVQKNYDAVAGIVNTTTHTACLLDKSNVAYGTLMENPGVNVAASSQHVAVFIPQDKAGTNSITGSTMLLKHTFSEMTQKEVLNGCMYLGMETKITDQIPMILSSVSFSKEEQIVPGTDVLKNNLKTPTVVVGLVKRSLLQSLKSKIEGTFSSGAYSFTEIKNANTSSEYCIYVLSSAKWKFRELKETTVSGDIKCLEIKIESLK